MSDINEVDLDVKGIPKTDSKIMPILEVLKVREPVIHHRELVSTIQDVDNETTEDFWEISASGCIYSRSIVKDALDKRFQDNEVDEMVSEN
ncbi:hypothetical protein HPK19_25515 (plasmid) [Arthrobacter citreus]|nr:hypothetical protein HPK19_25515 [Arthrobacter citreus]